MKITIILIIITLELVNNKIRGLASGPEGPYIIQRKHEYDDGT